jgi:hypothetical protein
MQTPTVILTDPAPLVDPDGRCPRCRADESKRVLSAGFGYPHEVCSSCGYAFPSEENRG